MYFELEQPKIKFSVIPNKIVYIGNINFDFTSMNGLQTSLKDNSKSDQQIIRYKYPQLQSMEIINNPIESSPLLKEFNEKLNKLKELLKDIKK